MEKKRGKKGRLCPFVGDASDECLLASMNSQDVEEAIYYCGGHYEECETYKKRAMYEDPYKGGAMG